ncbi:MAG: helix-turn-helix domain-containing protein, partial [Oscillospiraceae bacterium]|nr:helix-turn-helix domain-containing protein [Oscillospiraceae bacterium]
MKFSDKLIVLRKEKKLTQTQLAKILGISLRSIQNY